MLTSFLPFFQFAVVASVTPGPNNTMLAASGANFGFRRSLNHLVGVQFGFCSLVLLTTLGLGFVFSEFPLFQEILKWAGGAFILYLAFRIATASGMGGGEKAQPLRLIEAAAFQYLNPKAWVMSIAAASTYMPGEQYFLIEGLILTGGFLVAGTMSSILWVMFGVGIGRLLDQPWKLRLFNVTMAVLLVVSILQVMN